MQQLCLYHLSLKVRTTGCTLWKMHQDREDCAKLTDYVTKTWIEGRLSPIYLESLPDWGTQNHQPSKVLAQQVEKEGENCTFFNLWNYWRIQGGAATKWSKDVALCSWWQEEKNGEEVSRGRRKTSTSENSTDIWGEKLHPVWWFSILYFEAGLIY